MADEPHNIIIPKHIAIIMDGNGRWALEQGRERTYGHQAGVEAVKRTIEECVRLKVKYLTLYTFSMENWKRPKEEIASLMDLLLSSLEDEIFMKNNVRFSVIGDRKRLPQDVQIRLKQTEEKTLFNTTMTVVIALSYSSKWEITEAVRQIATKVIEGKINPEDINEETISTHLQTASMPDPDLLIRTGGEYRASNYLLWQIAYTELYFCNTYWPDFGVEELHKAIADYGKRQRRFGKTGAQIKGNEG